MLKAVPRWKAGMLQRQISQTNLRRRVRAFSLSDVYAGNANDSNGGRKRIAEAAFDGPSTAYRTDALRENVSSHPVNNLNENSCPFATTPFHPSDRYASFSRESTFPNVRFEDETIRTVANGASTKDDQRAGSIIAAGSEESLTEVKVENSTGSSEFCDSATDVPRNHPPGLAQPIVKQYQVSPPSRKP